jgi:hypothetical protein
MKMTSQMKKVWMKNSLIKRIVIKCNSY